MYRVKNILCLCYKLVELLENVISPMAKFSILYVAKINCMFVVNTLHFVNALKKELFLEDHLTFFCVLLQS